MAQEIKSQLGRLRSQAHLIRTSIEALIGIARFQAVVRWEEVLYQFNTLQRQMDDLRDEIVSLPLLSYFVLAPKRLPTNPDDSAPPAPPPTRRAAPRRRRSSGPAPPRSPDDALDARAPDHGGGHGGRTSAGGPPPPDGAPPRRRPANGSQSSRAGASRGAQRPRGRARRHSHRHFEEAPAGAATQG